MLSIKLPVSSHLFLLHYFTNFHTFCHVSFVTKNAPSTSPKVSNNFKIEKNILVHVFGVGRARMLRDPPLLEHGAGIAYLAKCIYQ